MFFLVAIGLWIVGHNLEKIGDEMIRAAQVEPEEEVVTDENIPQGDGVWIDQQEVFGLKWRRN